MNLQLMLQKEALGLYNVGGSTAIVHGLNAGQPNVVTHELTHKSITENSTLGFVATLCTAYLRVGMDPVCKRASRKYAARFVDDSFWVQEGCATAAEFIWGRSTERISGDKCPICQALVASLIEHVRKTHPYDRSAFISPTRLAAICHPTYYLAAIDFLTVIQKWGTLDLCPPGSELTVLIEPLVNEAIAIAAMSPPLPPDFVKTAIVDDAFQVCASHTALIWQRFTKICALPRAPVVAAIVAERPNLLRDHRERLAKFVRALCHAANLECDVPNREFVKQFPGLQSNLLVADGKDVPEQVAEFVYSSDLFPSRDVVLQQTTIDDVRQVRPNEGEHVAVELVPQDATNAVALAVHLFRGTGHKMSWLVARWAPNIEELELLFKQLGLSPAYAPSLLIVPRELMVGAAKVLSATWPLSHCFSFGTGLLGLKDAKQLGEIPGQSLWLAQFDDGHEIYAAKVPRGRPPQLIDERLRTLLWVAANGLLAHMKWKWIKI